MSATSTARPRGARARRAGTANTWCAWARRTASTCWGTSRCSATSGGIIAPMTTGGPGRIGAGRPGGDPAHRVGAAVPQQGGVVVAAALPQPARRARRGDRQRRHRRRRDDRAGATCTPASTPIPFRLVPLPELRLPGRRGGRHGQDERRHRRGHGAHLRPIPDRRSRSPTRTGRRPSAGAETFVTYGPLLEFAGGREADGQPDRASAAPGRTRRRVAGRPPA